MPHLTKNWPHFRYVCREQIVSVLTKRDNSRWPYDREFLANPSETVGYSEQHINDWRIVANDYAFDELPSNGARQSGRRRRSQCTFAKMLNRIGMCFSFRKIAIRKRSTW